MDDFIPRMMEVNQSYPPSARLDFPGLLREQFSLSGATQRITPGMRIAVGVGSRGISNLKEIVNATLAVLIDAGAKPFIVPAMGSHGGATPAGQIEVLRGYGISAETLGVPIDASMEVRSVGTALNGMDVLFSVPALQADGVVVVNRIKPHTDFRGTLGSGIQKMLTIGFGKQKGAGNAHQVAAHLGHETVIREFSKVILRSVPILCGVAILEDQRHQTAAIEVLPSEKIVNEEERLFERAWKLMPRLPLDKIDLLVVDEIGKEISGTGMDTNVIGRDITGYSTSLIVNNGSANGSAPKIARIFVRDLSSATHGNGIGIGLADFTTRRAIDALDKHSTFINAITSIGLHPAKIPIHFETDREAILTALASLATSNPATSRVVRIANTLSLERLLVAESCAPDLTGRPEVSITGSAEQMQFDGTGNLLPF